MSKGHRRSRRRRGNRAALTAFCVALTAIMLGLIGYVAHWYLNQARIRAEGERYAQLYPSRETSESPASAGNPSSVPTEAPTSPPTEAPTSPPTATPTPPPTEAPTSPPTATPTPPPTEAPTAIPTPVPTQTPVPTEAPTPTPVVTQAPTPSPSAVPTPIPTEAPTPTPVVTQAPAETPSPAPLATDMEMPVVKDMPLAREAPAERSEPAPTLDADMPVVEDVPIPTPDANTLVLALPTAPPVQSSFEGLLALNPETVGFLEIEGMLSLPVVQRENDNEYYLTHSFEGREAREGTLFLDGMNRLVPEDDCLIVYGHNMKNDTMFGRLSAYGDLAQLKQHPVLRFDTLYENRSYVVFSAFSASMEPKDSRYFNVRQFIFDEVEFDKFVLKLQSRSLFRIPVEVQYGDRLLMLVTCDYANREGRFILALRQLREDENEANLFAQVMQSEEK